MSKIIKADFDGSVVTLNSDGWINATAIADANGKRVGDWADLPSTREYVERLNTRFSGNLIQAKRGRNGGTWLHPKLESLNSVMISDSVSRDDRRERLADAVAKERASHVVQAIGVIGGEL